MMSPVVVVDGVRYVPEVTPSPLPLDILDVRDRPMSDVARDVEIGNIEQPTDGLVVDPELFKHLVYRDELLDGVVSELRARGYGFAPETVNASDVRRELSEVLDGLVGEAVEPVRAAAELHGIETDGPGMDVPETWIAAAVEIGERRGRSEVRAAFRRALGCTGRTV